MSCGISTLSYHGQHFPSKAGAPQLADTPKTEADVLLAGPQQKPENPSKNKLRKSWQNYYFSPTVVFEFSQVGLPKA